MPQWTVGLLTYVMQMALPKNATNDHMLHKHQVIRKNLFFYENADKYNKIENHIV